MNIQILPSLLAADVGALGAEIARVARSGADALHLDIMDAHFVPNLSFGPDVVALARRVVSRFPNVEVDTFDGLLAEYAKTFPEGAVIVKGLRANTDFENEFQMALINKKINPELDTMFLTASQKYTFLSSSVVKELAGYGADLTPFLPYEIIDDVHERATRGV